MENDRSGPKVKILNWGKANFDGIRQELSKVDRGSLWEGKGMAGKWETPPHHLHRQPFWPLIGSFARSYA